LPFCKVQNCESTWNWIRFVVTKDLIITSVWALFLYTNICRHRDSMKTYTNISFSLDVTSSFIVDMNKVRSVVYIWIDTVFTLTLCYRLRIICKIFPRPFKNHPKLNTTLNIAVWSLFRQPFPNNIYLIFYSDYTNI
jgi:hypothetical protein